MPNNRPLMLAAPVQRHAADAAPFAVDQFQTLVSAQTGRDHVPPSAFLPLATNRVRPIAAFAKHSQKRVPLAALVSAVPCLT